MVPETKRAPTIFSTEEIESFHRHGFVRLKQAFPPEAALALQDEIWTEIGEEHGVRREDRGTWKTLPRSPKGAKQSPLNAAVATQRFTGAISDLLGYDGWKRPATWGGFNVFFPEEPGTKWDVPSDTWHWDGPPTGEGLLIFSFYGDVRPGGGGTLVGDGSPRLIQSYYDSLSPADLARPHKFHRKTFLRWKPWLQALTGQAKEPVADRIEAFMERATEVHGVPCRVVELTGESGDAVFCNLGLMHAVAPNCSEQPRFMRVKFLFLD